MLCGIDVDMITNCFLWMRINNMLQRVIIFSLLFISSSVLAEQSVKIFTTGSYTKLLEKRHSQPFMLVLWSLDCSSCYIELAILSDTIKKQPKLDLVLVSTDKTADINEIKQHLIKVGLENISTWVFADNIQQQLRFEIDPTWYGELPRSYLFNVQHKRQAISGILNSAILQNWITYTANN
jgi:hypothetical protein